MKEIGQKNRGREYEALSDIDIKKEDIIDIKDLGISSINLAKGSVGSATLGMAAALGVKTVVIKGIIAYGAASTGATISSLSGVAATNATLAWLGGGAISAGGGGMAAGTMVLQGIAAGTFTAAAALSAGIILSAHGSKALTMATKYSAEVDKSVAALENSWIVMDGISERIRELKSLTLELESRGIEELDRLRVLVANFDISNMEHRKTFQKTALIMKSISEIANTPIIDETGGVSEVSGVVAGEIRSTINTKSLQTDGI